MLDLFVIAANALTSYLMYAHVTHNVGASVFGFFVGCGVWFIFFKD